MTIITFIISLLMNLTLTPCWATVYQLTVAQCDSDPTTGAFGRMGRYDNEFAITKEFQTELGLAPGDRVIVLTENGWAAWNLWDRMPGKGRRIDLQTGGMWSGDAIIITRRVRDGQVD